jgi:hypothetical protein
VVGCMRVLGMGDSDGVRAAPAMGGPEEGLGHGEIFHLQTAAHRHKSCWMRGNELGGVQVKSFPREICE